MQPLPDALVGNSPERLARLRRLTAGSPEEASRNQTSWSLRSLRSAASAAPIPTAKSAPPLGSTSAWGMRGAGHVFRKLNISSVRGRVLPENRQGRLCWVPDRNSLDRWKKVLPTDDEEREGEQQNDGHHRGPDEPRRMGTNSAPKDFQPFPRRTSGSDGEDSGKRLKE